MVLRERVRPQDLQAHLCDPSLSCPLRTRCVPPHLGHAPGPLARPAGPVGRLRAQRPREPPPLVVRPAPSPLAASCQASRVSPRHVFSLTTSWRRRGASSCRRWSNRELRIPTLQERALENTQLYPTISFCCLEMVALRRSPPRACVALVGARRPLRAPRRWARGRGDAALGARGPPGAGAPLRLPGDGRQDAAGRAPRGRPGRLRGARRRVRPLRSRPLAVSCGQGREGDRRDRRERPSRGLRECPGEGRQRRRRAHGGRSRRQRRTTRRAFRPRPGRSAGSGTQRRGEER